MEVPLGPDDKPLTGVKLKMWQKKQAKAAGSPKRPAGALPPPLPPKAPPPPPAAAAAHAASPLSEELLAEVETSGAKRAHKRESGALLGEIEAAGAKRIHKQDNATVIEEVESAGGKQALKKTNKMEIIMHQKKNRPKESALEHIQTRKLEAVLSSPNTPQQQQVSSGVPTSPAQTINPQQGSRNNGQAKVTGRVPAPPVTASPPPAFIPPSPVLSPKKGKLLGEIEIAGAKRAHKQESGALLGEIETAGAKRAHKQESGSLLGEIETAGARRIHKQEHGNFKREIETASAIFGRISAGTQSLPEQIVFPVPDLTKNATCLVPTAYGLVPTERVHSPEKPPVSVPVLPDSVRQVLAPPSDMPKISKTFISPTKGRIDLPSPVAQLGVPVSERYQPDYDSLGTVSPLTPRTQGRIDLMLQEHAAVAVENVVCVKNSHKDIAVLRKQREEMNDTLAALRERELTAEEKLRTRIGVTIFDIQAGLDALHLEMDSAGHNLTTMKWMLGEQITLTSQKHTLQWDAARGSELADELSSKLNAEWEEAQAVADSEKEAANQAQLRADKTLENSIVTEARYREAQNERWKLQDRVNTHERIEELAQRIHNLQDAFSCGDAYAIEMVQEALAELKSELQKRDRFTQSNVAAAIEAAAIETMALGE